LKKLVKGNEAVVIGALVADCDAYFGYPITPASEIAHAAAEYFLKLGKVFIQAESEIGAINMVFGASACGKRVMTASSGPGISLKQEGVSYLAGAELPCVIVDIDRVGPGLGNIGPEQGDYNQVVKGGGHGNYKVIVLAPNSVMEMYEMALSAFILADRYRMPVYVFADAMLGQMMEPIDIEETVQERFEKPWALETSALTNDNLVMSIFLEFDDMEAHIRKLEAKHARIAEQEAEAECWQLDDAEIVLTGYGIVSRLLRTVVEMLREQGIRAGLLRPKTLWPFPKEAYRQAAERNARFLAVELSTGQFVDDVRLSIPNAEVDLYSRVGGNLPTEEEIVRKVLQMVRSGEEAYSE
jgi:pyruvate/2-oxoacid:ferredoxin oxidoreductase alpha subunit